MRDQLGGDLLEPDRFTFQDSKGQALGVAVSSRPRVAEVWL